MANNPKLPKAKIALKGDAEPKFEAASPDALIEKALVSASQNPELDNLKGIDLANLTAEPSENKASDKISVTENPAQATAKNPENSEAEIKNLELETPQQLGNAPASELLNPNRDLSINPDNKEEDARITRPYYLSQFEAKSYYSILSNSVLTQTNLPAHAENISQTHVETARLFINSTPVHINQAPTDILFNAFNIAENAVNNSFVGLLIAVDTDSSLFRYELVDDAGGRFALVDNSIVVADSSLLNYENASSHNIIVRVIDAEGASYEKSLVINLDNVNEAPVLNAIDDISLAENIAAGVVRTAVANDVDAGDHITYSLANNFGGIFSIDAATGEITHNGSFNFEATPSYNLTVIATDANGLSDAKSFAVNISNVNEAPTDITLSANSIAENSANNAVIGSLSRTDVDSGDTATYTLLDNAGGRFAISGSNLIVNNSSLLNFEAATSHSVTVRVTDAGGLSYDKTFTINVTNVNEAPTDITLSANSIAENTGTASAVTIGSFSSSDVDAGDTATYSLVSGTGSSDNAKFQIVGNNLQIKAGQSIDFETQASYSVRVQVTDADGSSYQKVFTINATNVNEAPVLNAISDINIAENTAAGALGRTASASDPDSGSTITYSLQNNHGGIFSIDASTGVISHNGSFNFENTNSYALTVIASDGTLTDSKSFNVNIANVNEAPTDILLSANSIAENSANNSVIGSLSRSDVDSGDTATYSLVDNAGGRFAISGSNLVVNNSSLLNFEAATSHSVTVRVTDAGGLSYDKTFTINVTNVNEAPTDILLSANSIAENSANNSVIGSLSRSDVDSGDTATYSLVDNAGGRFAISGSNLVVNNSSLLNFEAATSHSVTVRVTDAGGLSYDKTFTINVTNVNEAPTDISLSANSIAENTNTASAVTIGSLSRTDVDAGDSATYSLVSGTGSSDNAKFQIVGNNLQIKAGQSIDFETQASYSVRVQVTDAGGLSYQKVFTINATNVNEAPTLSAISNITINENTAAGALGRTASASDPDSGSTITYSLQNNYGGIFSIDASTGVISHNGSFNFEGTSSYNLTVIANDGALTDSKSFTVNVANINEAPTDISLSANSIAENSANSTVIGSLSRTDVDSGDTASYSLVDNASGRFAISGSNLVVNNSSLLDYEANTSHSVTVRVTDSGGLTYDKTFTINVTDVADQTINGTSAANTLSGTSSSEIIIGGYGGDTISGGAGNDIIYADNQAFTSTSVAGLVVWFDPKTLAGTANNASVSSWADSSTTGLTAVTGGTGVINGTAPTYVSNWLNGQGALSFNGSSTMLTTAYNAAFNLTNNFTFITLASTSSTSDWRKIAGNADSSHHGYGFGLEGGGNYVTTTFSLKDYDGVGTWTANSPTIFGSVLNSSNANSMYANGSLLGTVSGSTPAFSSSGGFTIGGVGDRPEYWLGNIADVMLFNSVLSATDLKIVNEYLSFKYGLALSGYTTATAFGADILTGGAGNDSFAWTNASYSGVGAGSGTRDIITDFKQGNAGVYQTGETDTINFTSMNLTWGNFDYTTDLRAEFSGVANQLIWDSASESGKTILKIDFGGNGSNLTGADMEIQLTGNMWLFGDEFQGVSGVNTGSFTSGTNNFNPGNNAANIYTAGSLSDFNLSVDTYTGGTGSDTIRLFNSDNSSMNLDLSVVSSLGSKLNGIEHFDLSSGSNANTLKLTAQNVFDITDSDHKLFIHGDGSDHVVIGNGWTSTGLTTIQGVSFNDYTQTVSGSLVHMYIETDITNVTVS